VITYCQMELKMRETILTLQLFKMQLLLQPSESHLNSNQSHFRGQHNCNSPILSQSPYRNHKNGCKTCFSMTVQISWYKIKESGKFEPR
jgi:hypothetical protein